MSLFCYLLWGWYLHKLWYVRTLQKKFCDLNLLTKCSRSFHEPSFKTAINSYEPLQYPYKQVAKPFFVMLQYVPYVIYAYSMDLSIGWLFTSPTLPRLLAYIEIGQIDGQLRTYMHALFMLIAITDI